MAKNLGLPTYSRQGPNITTSRKIITSSVYVIKLCELIFAMCYDNLLVNRYSDAEPINLAGVAMIIDYIGMSTDDDQSRSEAVNDMSV